MTRKKRIQVGAAHKRRLKVLFVVVFLVFSCIAWISANHDQLIPYLITSPSPSVKVDRNSVYLRGTIYDRTYKELAFSQERVSVYALPREVGALSETAARLAPILGRSKNELLLKLNSDAVRVWLARDVSQDTEVKIRNIKLPGVFLGKEAVRRYPQRQSMAHLLGYMDKDRGLAGIEWHYNDLLENYGAQPEDINRESGPRKKRREESGVHLVLTFDVKIQQKLEDAVRHLAAKSGGIQVAACVMEMSSGALVASAHYPSFEPNRFSEYDKKILENILLRPLAVPEKIRRFFKDASLVQAQYEKNGTVLPWSILSEEISLGSQIRFWEHLSLSSSLQLDFAKDDAGNLEKKPLLPITAPLDFGAVPEVATPYQLLTGITHLFNGGKKIVPFVLDRVMERETKKESSVRKENRVAISNKVTSDFSEEMKKLLDSQSQSGPFGSRLLAGEQVAFFNMNQDFQYVKNRIMFVCFPNDNSDLIFMFVVKKVSLYPQKDYIVQKDIDNEVKKIIEPVVALQEVISSSRGEMEVSEKKEMNFQVLNIGSSVETSGPPATRIRIASGEFEMPDLKDLSLRKSLRLLQKKNLKVKFDGFGRVVEQEPAAGVSLENRKECRLVLRSTYSISPSKNKIDTR